MCKWLFCQLALNSLLLALGRFIIIVEAWYCLFTLSDVVNGKIHWCHWFGNLNDLWQTRMTQDVSYWHHHYTSQDMWHQAVIGILFRCMCCMCRSWIFLRSSSQECLLGCHPECFASRLSDMRLRCQWQTETPHSSLRSHDSHSSDSAVCFCEFYEQGILGINLTSW